MKKANLKTGLEVISKIITSKSFNPEIQEIRIESRANGDTRFISNDLDNILYFDYKGQDANLSEPMTFDHKQIMKSFNDFQFACIDDKIVINEGKKTAKEVLSIAEVKIELFPKISTEVYKVDFYNASKFVSKDELRIAMTGIYLDCSKGYAVSTDAHQLYFSETSKTEQKSFIINPVICKLLSGLKITEIQVSETEKRNMYYISFTYNDINFTCLTKCVDARYPDYLAVIPVENPIEANVLKTDIETAVKEVLPWANSATNRVCLTFENNNLSLHAEDINFSREMKIDINCQCETLNIFCSNGKLLLIALSTFDKNEQIKIVHSGISSRAAIFIGVAHKILVMPICTGY